MKRSDRTDAPTGMVAGTQMHAVRTANAAEGSFRRELEAQPAMPRHGTATGHCYAFFGKDEPPKPRA